MKTLFQPREPLREDTNRFTVSVHVPGMSKKDLSVYIEGNVLFIATKSKDTLPEHPGARKHRGIMYTFALPPGVDKDGIQAKYRNGLLTIDIEKINHILIKVLGQENSAKDTWRMSTLWNTIKAKLNARKIAPNGSSRALVQMRNIHPLKP